MNIKKKTPPAIVNELENEQTTAWRNCVVNMNMAKDL